MRKLALIIPALLAFGAGAYYVQILGSEIALMERFPDHDPNLVIKVHREMIKETLAGKHADATTDEELDKIMLHKLAAYRSPDTF